MKDLNDLNDAFEQAKNETLFNQCKWEKSLYFSFMKNSNQKEFLLSQIPFFKAVEAFPRMLALLASKIKTSEQRLLVVENLWEEHGAGFNANFHTSTFKSYLNILSKNEGYEEECNPFVNDWIEKILNSNRTSSELGIILSAIEYMYAVISNDIAKKINTFSLSKDPIHYSKHSVLDWEHGKELLKVALFEEEKLDLELFSDTQVDFISLFNRLAFPTKKELIETSKLPISFYYSREDSLIGLEALNLIKKNEVDVFTICSGGEHALNYLIESHKLINLTLSDVNENQLDLFKDKLNLNKDYLNGIGKFEFFFSYLRGMFQIERCTENPYLEYICDNHKGKMFNYAMEKIFSRENLNIVFTENATKYSKENFSLHFSHAIRESFFYRNNNAFNILYGISSTPDYSSISNISEDKKSRINYKLGDLRFSEFDKEYDLIDLSNIGDWMDIEDYKVVLYKAYNSLKKDGVLIVRKLLGDYSLKELLNDYSEVLPFEDSTCFYSEGYYGIK